MEQKKKLVGKRLLALLLTLTMILGMIPATVFGAETECTVTDNVIDITDKQIYARGSLKATAVNIRIEGVTVEEAYEDGTNVVVVLPYNTEDHAEISVTVGTTSNRLTVSGNTGSLILDNGEGTLVLNVKAQYASLSNVSGTVTYTLAFCRAEPPVEVPARVQAEYTEEVWKGWPVELAVNTYFTNGETYYLLEEGDKIPVEDGVYAYTPTQSGQQILVFGAENQIGECPDTVTVTVSVKEIEGGIWIGHSTSNGSLDSVSFTDAEGNFIEGIETAYSAKTITVILPKNYDLAGKVTATFSRTPNDSDYPRLSSSNAFNQGNGSWNDVFTNTLSNGAGMRTVYLYNSVPKATSNSYEAFTIVYKVKNELPVLADGVESSIEAAITAGEIYTLDLEPLFTDADYDELTYLVSINGAAAVETDVNYTYTTNVAGEYSLKFTANDGKDVSEETYTVTLTVGDSKETDSMTVNVPEGVEPKFYVTSGFDNGIDQLGAELEVIQSNTSGGAIAYTVNYPINVSELSVRTDAWGGMAFAVEKDGVVTLRQMTLSVVDYTNASTESTNTVTYDGYTAVAGTDGWLLAAGKEYTCTASPVDTANLAKATETVIVEAGEGIYVCEMMLGLNNPLTITVPTGARAQLYKYNKYYDNTEYDAKIIKDNGDGTTTFSFIADSKSVGMIYRVSMQDKITKAGWLDWGKQNLTVTYSDDDKEPSYRLEDYSAAGTANSSVAEDSVLLNINSRNHLNLSVGQTKTLKAYRAWEIIPVSYNNWIIPPDFTYTILSGDDVVQLTEKASASAADGDWMTLKALKEGVAVIEVTYDAIQVSGGQYDGIYGASDPARSGLVVVQVGESDDSSVDFGIESYTSIGKSGSSNISYDASNKKAWDAEFDTLYFIGNSGELKLTPSASGAISEVAVSHDQGDSWIVLENENGTYTAEIVSGNNMIRVKTEIGTAYQVVRGDKLTVTLKEVDGGSDGDGIVEAGETIRVSLLGLHAPIPKMAGNYNPGYGGNQDGYSSQHLNYISNGEAIYGPGTQYNFITAANYVDIVMPEDGSSVTLSEGYIGLGVIGLTSFTDGGDSHRNIPDTGCATRGSESTFHTRSILPEITVDAGDTSAPNSAPIVRADATAEGSIYADQKFALNPDTLFRDPDGNPLTFTVSVNGGEETRIGVDYKFAPAGAGTYILVFTASDGKETAQHTITMTVTERPQEEENDREDAFGLLESEIAGYVTISFEDNAVRVEGETGLDYPVPLGTIVPETQVPFRAGETIAQVTKRVLDYYGIGMEYSGTLTNGFYLGAITDFEVDGTPYDSMGEFDAGVGSGWMITWEGEFINKGASEFTVKNGDSVRWMYTCQLGADIDDPYWNDKEYSPSGRLPEEQPSASITPEVSVNSKGEATVEIEEEELNSAVEEATKDYAAGEVVIAPEIKGDASKVTVELPKGSVDKLADGSADLIIKTDIAEVTLTAEALKELPAEGTSVTVAVEAVKGDAAAEAGSTAAMDKIKVEVAVDTKAVERLDAGVAVTIPAENVSATSVLVIVDENGNETIVKKSSVSEGEISALLDGSCTVVVKNNKKEFTDTEGHWGKAAAEFASSRELFNGVGNGQFGMNVTMNRAMLATVFYNLENAPDHDGEHDFHDVHEGRYYEVPAAWAADQGILSGYTDGSFRPDAPVTREQLAVMLWNYSGKPAADKTKDLDFSDTAEISNYAKEALQWAVENGVMSGRTGGKLDPKGNATRAEVAQMFKNYIEKVVL